RVRRRERTDRDDRDDDDDRVPPGPPRMLRLALVHMEGIDARARGDFRHALHACCGWPCCIWKVSTGGLVELDRPFGLPQAYARNSKLGFTIRFSPRWAASTPSTTRRVSRRAPPPRSAPRWSASRPSTTRRVPRLNPRIVRRPIHITVTSPVPSDRIASSDSWPSSGRTVIRRTTPASLTRERADASAIRTLPGTLSAHARISSA